MNRPGTYRVTVTIKGAPRVMLIQGKSAADASRKVLAGTVTAVEWYGGSR